MLETEKIKVEFRKKAAERVAAERKAALERQKKFNEMKQEERKKKAQQIMDTEKIEQKAITLHSKARELQKQKLLVKDARQEIEVELRRLKANLKFAQRAKQAAQKIKKRITERREWMKKHREEVLNLRKKQREQALKEYEAEQERREKLQETCPHAKVRSYECNADGFRLVKIFRFLYDVQQERCVPKVQRKTISCRSAQPTDFDPEGLRDPFSFQGPSDYSRWKYDVQGDYPFDLTKKMDFEDYGYGNDYDYGLGSDFDSYRPRSRGRGWYGGYIRADDFAARKNEKVAAQKSDSLTKDVPSPSDPNE